MGGASTPRSLSADLALLSSRQRDSPAEFEGYLWLSDRVAPAAATERDVAAVDAQGGEGFQLSFSKCRNPECVETPRFYLGGGGVSET